MNKTSIEWALNPDGTQGYTWNPLTGCLNNCPYCYARKLANTRLKERYLAGGIFPISPSLHERYPNCLLDPFYPRFWEDRLDELNPVYGQDHRAKFKGIFVCDMSDLFGIGIPEEWTRKVLDRIREFPYHRFYLLTKQPQNLIKFSPFPDNCWVGVSATNYEGFLKAIYYLPKIKANVKYISFEPLLEGMGEHIKGWLQACLIDGGINWVIIGAQTKPTVYPKIEWVKEIVEACDKAGVKVFLKNNLKPLLEEEPYDRTFWADIANDGRARERVTDNLRQEMPDAL